MPLFNNRQIDPIWKVSLSTNIPSKNVKEKEQKKNYPNSRRIFFCFVSVVWSNKKNEKFLRENSTKERKQQKKKVLFRNSSLLFSHFFLHFFAPFLWYDFDDLLYYYLSRTTLHTSILYEWIEKKCFSFVPKKIRFVIMEFSDDFGIFLFPFLGRQQEI